MQHVVGIQRYGELGESYFLRLTLSTIYIEFFFLNFYFNVTYIFIVSLNQFLISFVKKNCLKCYFNNPSYAC